MKWLQETCILFGKTCVTSRPAQELTGKSLNESLNENLQRKCKEKKRKPLEIYHFVQLRKALHKFMYDGKGKNA